MSISNSRLLAAGLGAALLSGCAAVGPTYVPPAAQGGAAYTAPGERGPAKAALGTDLAQDWWTLFRSPQIDAVVRQAVSGNQSLEAARERLVQARQTVAGQTGALQGDLTAGASRQHINLAAFGFSSFGGVKLQNPTVDLYSVGASARYDFDLFGGRRREGESRQARAEASAQELNAAYLTLTGQVVNQAVAIASLKAQIAAAEDLGAQDQALIDLAEKALAGGSGTGLDVAGARSQLAEDEAALPALRQQLAVAQHALALLVGRTPSDWNPPAFDLDGISLPDTLPVALPSELAHRRPDIRAAEARLHAAVAQVGAAEARLYPNLTLSGNLTQTSLEPDKVFSTDFSGWSLGPLGISLPIFDRGALKAQSAGARAAARAAAADYRQAVLQAFAQVADVLQALRNDEIAFAAQGQAVAAAQETLRLSRLRFEGGKGGAGPVLSAQRAYQRARLAYVRAQTQRYLDAAQLFLVTGGGWTGDGERTSTKG